MSFSLRDFHYAVSRLPSDSYSAPIIEDSFLFCDLDMSCLLSHELLHYGLKHQKDVDMKIVLISSCLVSNMDSNIRKCLLDAADRCVSVEFVFLEQNSNQLGDISESINKFREEICDLENCSFSAYLPDQQAFNGLAKRWVGELKRDDILHWQARLVFQKNIVGSVNEILCKLCNSTNYIMDGFSPCKRCRSSWDDRDDLKFKGDISCCNGSVNWKPEHSDEHSIKADEHTLLTKEFWMSWMDHCPLSSTVHLNVAERTSLASLSEGIMVGNPYIVIPSGSMEVDTTDESDKCQLNNIFRGICRALHSQNQGLVCWTSCNINTMRETTFHYYYILQPSDNGLMLLRRLAVAEEILPFPDLNESDSSAADEFDNYVKQGLQEVELRDYNPVQHIGFFHQKINQLVHESLQSGPVISDISSPVSDMTCHDVPAVQPSLSTNVPTPQGPEKCISEEWEQFIVGGGMPMESVPSEPDMEDPRTSPIVTQRTLDSRTSKILERLGNPKEKKTKLQTSPTTILSVCSIADSMTVSRLDVSSQALTTTSCLLKPTFHRLKRKQR